VRARVIVCDGVRARGSRVGVRARVTGLGIELCMGEGDRGCDVGSESSTTKRITMKK